MKNFNEEYLLFYDIKYKIKFENNDLIKLKKYLKNNIKMKGHNEIY